MTKETIEYDEHGRKIRVKTIDGREYVYSYDYRGRVTCDEVGCGSPFSNLTPIVVPKVNYGIRRPEIMNHKGWREW